MEVLVVLTMVSMLSALLFQGFGYMLATYDRLQDRQSREFRESLAAGWWRDSLEAAVPYYESPLRFAGDDNTISASSYAPLWGSTGIPSEMKWSLEQESGDLLLVYTEPPMEAVVVQRWERAVNAGFSYLSEAGEWQQDWRPERDRQLPEAIRLMVQVSDNGAIDTMVLTATVPIRKSQFVPTTDVLYGRE